MAITSFWFLCFFGIALILYYVIPRKLQWVLLLFLGSAYFLTSTEVADSGAWYVCFYPLVSVGAVWLAAKVIDRAKEQKKKKAALICAVIFCVLLLCTLKFWKLPLYAPMGIAFYTLTLLGYLFDVYYEIGPVQNNYAKLLLFGCYFPTLISGPITKYRELKDSLYGQHRFDYRQIAFGMQRMLWGFFKKLVIAERMALIANEVFDNYTQYSGFAVWMGAIAFTFQLYTDFDGCMDIVLGISQCFGIKLPENFNAPFLAKSIQEFWQRWHMTLGTWLREYLFYPLLRTKFFMALPKRLKEKCGKKKAKQITTFSAMFILWAVVGYWHGGGMTFVIGSGLLHWFYIVSGELLEPVFKKMRTALHIKAEQKWFICFQQIRTFLLVTLGFVFFRSPSVADAFKYLGQGLRGYSLSFFSKGELFGLGLDWIELGVAVVSLIIFFAVTNLTQKGSMYEWLEKRPVVVRWAILYALLFYVILLGKYGPDFSASEFIYQNFKV